MEEKREIIYSDISSASRKQPYDAMVYIDGTSVIAVDSDGHKIATGTAGTDDHTVIQAAIDSLSNGGDISIARGTYAISARIDIEVNIRIQCAQGTIFVPTVDTDMFYMKNSTRLYGCKIDVSGLTGYSSACILIDGSERISAVAGKSGIQIRDIWFNNAAYTGTAIYLKSTQSTEDSPSTGYIYGVSVSDIRIHKFDYGIRLYRTGEYGSNWANGNHFSHIRGAFTRRFIHMGTDTGVGSDLDGNVFDYIDFQSGHTPTEPAITIHGRYNVIEHCMIFDWRQEWGTPAFVFAEGSNSNHVMLVAGSTYRYSNYGHSTNTCFDTSGGTLRGSYTFESGVRLHANCLTVGATGCNYTTLRDAVKAVSNPSSTNRYTIEVYGTTDESTSVYIPSYTTVIGHNAVVNLDESTGASININGATDSTLMDLAVIRSGSSDISRISCINISGSNGITLDNIHVRNDVVGTVTHQHGIYTSEAKDITITNCSFVGGGRVLTGSGGYAAYIQFGTTGQILNSTFSPGFGNDSQGFYSSGADNLVVSNCIFKYDEFADTFTYTGGEYTKVLHDTSPTFITDSISVNVTTAGTAGSKISIGTTDGGEEIGSVVSDYVGYKTPKSHTLVLVSPGTPIYFKPSDPSVRFVARYSCGYDTAGAYALRIGPRDHTLYHGCTILSNMNSPACYIATSRTGYTLDGCHIESLGTYDIEVYGPTIVNAYNCTFGSGRFLNVTGFPGQGAATVAAGATYVDVTHNLPNTPRIVRVTPTSNLGAKAFWVSDKGTETFRINISESDSTDHTFDWVAEV